MKPPILDRIPLDRPAVIEASAGTGKTYTLEHLAVELVLGGELELEKILIVTFTERAAAELRSRLRAKLKKLVESPGELDEAARAKLMRAVSTFDLATISTIHAFCQQVLIENAFASHRLFDQELVDGRVAFSRAFMTTLRKTLARAPRHRGYLDAWLTTGTLDTLQTLLYDCHTKRGTFAPEWSETRLFDALGRFANAKVELGVLSMQLVRMKLHPSTKKAVLDRYQDLNALLLKDPRSVAHLLRGLNGIDFAYLEKTFADRLPMMDANIRPCVEAWLGLGRAAVPIDSAVAQTFLPPIEEEMRRDKAKSGQLDFDDMLRMLWESLDGPDGPALAEAMRARYRCALVDEFQDTDDVQWKIFERVFLGAGTKLYVIGDPKQAIYAFRGADVHTYLSATEKILASGGTQVTLTENFRSTAPLIEAVNFVLDQGADPPFFDGAIRYDHPVTASRVPREEDLGGAPVRLIQVSTRDGGMTPAKARAALADRYAREISALLGAGVEPGEIFVLARTTKECTDVGSWLRGARIPIAFYKQEGLFQTDEAKDIRELLTAVADPKSQSRRFRAWIGPFFSVPLEALPNCVDLPGNHPLLARLFEWNALAGAKDYDHLFTRMLEDSGLVERELFFEQSERELTNYLHIFEILLEEAHRSRPTLEEMIHTLSAFIDERRLPEGENGNVQRLESEKSAVQIMTMHKAKGLEARVVFLIGGFDRGPSSKVHVFHEGYERRLSVGKSGFEEEIKREEEEEGQRVLYVALTRAKERLYLPYFAGSRDGARVKRELGNLGGIYRHLNEALDRAVTSIERGSTSFSLEKVFIEDVDPERASRASRESIARWTPPAELLARPEPDRTLLALRGERAGWSISSYSKMKAQAGGYKPPPLRAEDDEPAIDAGLGASPLENTGAVVAAIGAALAGAAVPKLPTDLPGGTASGRFLHEVLEKLPFETILDSATFEFWAQRNDVKSVFSEAMKNHDREPKYLRHSQELVWAALTSPIGLGKAGPSLERGIAGARQIVREMEFLYPVAAPGFIKGYIDLVFEHADRIYLLDWKSDLLPSYGADELEVHSRNNYELQAELYALALVKMLGLSTREAYEAKFGGTLYCYVRGMRGAGEGVMFRRPSWGDIVKSAKELS